MAPLRTSLKPFVFNLSDLGFLLRQVAFRPLFDQFGNAIINWDGTSAIYDGHGAQIWNGVGLARNGVDHGQDLGSAIGGRHHCARHTPIMAWQGPRSAVNGGSDYAGHRSRRGSRPVAMA